MSPLKRGNLLKYITHIRQASTKARLKAAARQRLQWSCRRSLRRISNRGQSKVCSETLRLSLKSGAEIDAIVWLCFVEKLRLNNGKIFSKPDSKLSFCLKLYRSFCGFSKMRILRKVLIQIK